MTLIEQIRADVDAGKVIDATEYALLAAEKLADAISLERDARKAYKETPNDRGGSHGPKGKARHAWLLRRGMTNSALTAFRKATGTEE